MIASGRHTEEMIPDDFEWLLEAITEAEKRDRETRDLLGLIADMDRAERMREHA